MLFKIYVGCNYENGGFSRDTVKSYITDEMKNNGLNGGTIFDGVGIWQGETENTEIVEIYGSVKLWKSVKKLCKALKKDLNQYSIGFSFSFVSFLEIK